MDDKTAAILRKPFPPEQIGKLPRSTKRDNQKGKCSECGGWHGLPAVHLDYVGHAAATDRLLAADPGWTWEPMGVNTDGTPVIVESGHSLALWIRLTVGGVTRPGVGTVDKGANDPVKELISDAIRNAAMRFGVALDLWAKEDLTPVVESDPVRPTPPAPTQSVTPAPQPPLESKSRANGDDLAGLVGMRNAVLTKLRELPPAERPAAPSAVGKMTREELESVMVGMGMST